MTNGEMIQKVFNCEVCEPIIEDDIIHVIFADKKDSAIGFDWSWWNAEYKEPTTKNDIAQERYQDLIEYFGDEKVAKTILKSRKEFKAWLERLRWNVKRADELARELEQIKSITKNDLGVDAVSRKEVYNQIFYSTDNNGDVVLGSVLRERIARLPSVTPQLSSGLDKNSKKLEKNFGELDCISRQAVLDLIADYDLSMGQVVRGIHALPPVTPQEPITWIVGKNNAKIAVKNMPIDKLHKICAIIGDEQELKWIPASERLPEAECGESDSVLVCFENQTQDVLYFDGGNWCYPTGETYISVNHKNDWHNRVVAWMPLPKPYEPQESEDKE